MSIVVIGKEQLLAALAAMADDLQSPDVRAGFARAAALIRDRARANAPKRGGWLRRAIVSFAGRRKGRRVEPAAYARVNILSGRSKAPHGHFVEFGTVARRPKKKRFMKFSGALGIGIGVGFDVFAKKVARMRPKPFFQKAVQTNDERALTVAVEAIRKRIEKRNRPVREFPGF